MKSSLILILRMYKALVSPILPFNHCRFVPSCSEYSVEAVMKYGALKGALLAARRVLRCHPFHTHDPYDPVP